MGWLSDCSDKTFCFNPGVCGEGNVSMAEQAYSACLFSNSIAYSYKIDLGNNGGIDIQSSEDTCTGLFQQGTHRIYWRASDECGNAISCSYLFTVKDCTPPNLICINGLTQNIQLPECATSFTPAQFVLSFSDNCTPSDQIEFGIREAGTGTGFPTTTSISFGICDAGLNLLEIWARDGSGLSNLCQNYVLVQPNGTSCECNPDAEIDFAGCVRTAGNKKLDEYKVIAKVESISGVQPPLTKTVMGTITDSCYALQVAELPFGAQYRTNVRAERTNLPASGISTFDLVVMSKHILAIEPFSSVYQSIASDVNQSNSVTAFDIVETRKLLLGIYDVFPANSSWRFVRPLADPTDFAALPTVKDTYQIILNNVVDDLTLSGLHFVGVKIGDANLSASFAPDPDDRAGAIALRADDRWLAAGETTTVTLRPGEAAALSGWQLGLRIDPGLVRFEGVENLPAESYHFSPEGVLRALWFDAAGRDFSPDEAVLTLKITALQPVRLAEALTQADEALPAEAYSASPLARRRMALHIAPKVENDAAIQVFPPWPNPARTTATLAIRSAVGGEEATLTWYDTGGRRLGERRQALVSGYQEVALPLEDLPAGVLSWQLRVGKAMWNGRLVKK